MNNIHSRRRILAVEDNEINLKMILDILNTHRYDVVGAKNGSMTNLRAIISHCRRQNRQGTQYYT